MDKLSPALTRYPSGMTRIPCSLCGLGFDCGASDTRTPCWCVALPSLPRQALGQSAQTCFCPDCLREQLRQQGVTTDAQELP